MDISKHQEFFNPILDFNDQIHIIGLGAIGSNLCEMLTRLGFQKIHIYDFDIVNEHNLANQNYDALDVNAPKTICTRNNMIMINQDIKVTAHNDGWQPETPLSGYVFLCVDSIELRQKITKECMLNPNIKAMFDFRMRLSDAQHYASDFSNQKSKKAFLDNMNFTDEEAKAETPISACGTTLSVIPTVKTIVALGVANFINFVKTKELKQIILIDAFKFEILAI